MTDKRNILQDYMTDCDIQTFVKELIKVIGHGNGAVRIEIRNHHVLFIDGTIRHKPKKEQVT
jgi:hypothetical protein